MREIISDPIALGTRTLVDRVLSMDSSLGRRVHRFYPPSDPRPTWILHRTWKLSDQNCSPQQKPRTGWAAGARWQRLGWAILNRFLRNPGAVFSP